MSKRRRSVSGGNPLGRLQKLQLRTKKETGFEVKAELYPGKDYRGIERVDVVIRIAGNFKLLRKTFYIPKSKEGLQVCQLKNKAGVSYDIPLEVMDKIYDYLTEIKSKLKSGESVETVTKPNPTIKEFTENTFRDMFIKKNPKQGWLIEKITEYFGNKRIKEINCIHIEKFKVDMKSQNHASSTIRKYCLILRSILNVAVELGYINKNPSKSVKLPSNKPEKERDSIETELLPGLFFKMKQANIYLYTYCKFIYLTGLRSSDVIHLKYENIIVLNGIKCISLQESKNKDKETRGKTIVPVHPALIEMLEDKGTGYIIKYPYARANMLHRMSRFFKEICLDYTPYHFRHTFATELSKANVSETHINFLLGKLPEGSMKNYLKRDIGTLYEAVKKLKFTECEPVENKVDLMLG